MAGPAISRPPERRRRGRCGRRRNEPPLRLLTRAASVIINAIMADTPREVLERFRRGATLMPGLSDEEIGRLQRRISAPIPEPIRELLRYAAGFQLPSVGSVQFTGAGTVDLPGALPESLALLADGSGNSWVV